MDEEDYRIAARCGISRVAAKRIFDEAIANHQDMREDIDAMYDARETYGCDNDDGETMRQQVERHMKLGW